VSAIVDYTSAKRNVAEKGKNTMNDMVLAISVMNYEIIIYFMCL